MIYVYDLCARQIVLPPRGQKGKTWGGGEKLLVECELIIQSYIYSDLSLNV